MTSQRDTPQPNAQAQLSVRNGRAAVNFYKAAFGAVEVYRFGGTDDLEEVVAQLAVGDSLFWVEDESPPHGNCSPETVGGATARMLLIVDDPESVVARAIAGGATPISPVGDEHGWRLGRIDDPFGHRWEMGEPINDWPPAAQLGLRLHRPRRRSVGGLVPRAELYRLRRPDLDRVGRGGDGPAARCLGGDRLHPVTVVEPARSIVRRSLQQPGLSLPRFRGPGTGRLRVDGIRS